MAEAFYRRMQGVASSLLGQFQQGAVTYTITGEPTGPAYAPVPGVPQTYTLDAAVSGVGEMYRDSTLIIETDKLVTAAVFGATPTVQGTLSIDGRAHQIVQVTQVPAAGVPVAWKIVARA